MSEGTHPVAPRIGARRLLLAAAAYALLAVIYTWPAITELRTSLLAGPWDGPMFLWNMWWGPHGLFELHQDPLTTHHLFHPKGASLVVNTHNLLPSLASWPLQELFGLVAAFNLMVLLTFVLAGLGGCLLTNELVGDWRASFLGGAVFSFGHLRVSKIVFFNLIQSWLLAFWAFALWRAVRLRSWRWSVAAGVIGAAIFWTDYNLTVFAALWGVAFGIYALLDARRLGSTRSGLLARFGAMAIVCGVLSFPLARRLTAEWAPEPEILSLKLVDASREATPVWRFYAWGPFEGPGPSGEQVPGRQAAFLGYATLALALCGLWVRRKERATQLLAAVALGFLLLALGPELNLGDGIQPAEEQSVHVPLPWRWVQDVPVLGEIRIAHRFGVLAWLALAVAAGVGMRELLRRIEAGAAGRARLLGGVATALACAGVMVDFTRLPFAVRTALPPLADPLREVAADPRDCAVVEWPGGRMGDPFFGYYQAIHGKPVFLDGPLARTPIELIQAQRASAVRRALLLAFGDEDLGQPKYRMVADTAQAEARRQKVGWLLLSQFDVELMTRKRKVWTRARLHEIDARVRALFPQAKRTWLASDEEIAAFVRPAGGKRWSKGTLFAVYLLP